MLNSAGGVALTGANPNGWVIGLFNPDLGFSFNGVQIVCQTPITVAGVSVPEFGSLYVAIALGAVVYFILSRRITTKPTLSAQA
jgi:hypothetical protein